jgi:hypothetical protein
VIAQTLKHVADSGGRAGEGGIVCMEDVILFVIVVALCRCLINCVVSVLQVRREPANGRRIEALARSRRPPHPRRYSARSKSNAARIPPCAFKTGMAAGRTSSSPRHTGRPVDAWEALRRSCAATSDQPEPDIARSREGYRGATRCGSSTAGRFTSRPTA